MLTITHNNKTYRWLGDNYGDIPVKGFELRIDEHKRIYLYDYVSADACSYEVKTYHTIKQLVKLGYMEELKPLSQKRAEAIERGKELTDKHDIQAKTHHGTDIDVATSILEKLRYGIDKLTIYCRSIYSADCSRGETEKEKNTHMVELSQVLDLLTSIETSQTKEEPCGHNRISTEGICRECGEKRPGHWAVEGYPKEQPQFTPGQEIEVSNDGEKWWKREYVNYEPSLWYFGVSKYCTIYRAENGCLEEKWKFARPIEDKIDHDQVKENIRVMDEQDGKIEPELPSVPDFVAYPNKNTGEIYLQDRYAEQLEALTTFCQALARQKTTK